MSLIHAIAAFLLGIGHVFSPAPAPAPAPSLPLGFYGVQVTNPDGSTRQVLEHFPTGGASTRLDARSFTTTRRTVEAGGATASQVLPDPQLTPGMVNPAVTQSTISKTICVKGWTATPGLRPSVKYTGALKTKQIAQYGYADTSPSSYEEDHLISLELGGSPTDPANLWPEPYSAVDENGQLAGAHQKDLVENAMKKLVCEGKMPLATAQQQIATDWYGAYKSLIGLGGGEDVRDIDDELVQVNLGGQQPSGNDVSDLLAAQQELRGDKLGATNSVPSVVALFETSLAAGITSTATSFTLTSGADLAGTTLASSTYAFIIDENSASQEMVIADCTNTTCANAIRGASVVTGTTTVAALEHSHRRGASVKITDGPQLNILSRIATGQGFLPTTLHYASTRSGIGSDLTAVPDVNYVNSTVGAGAADASPTVKGVVQEATGAQAAAGAADGSGSTSAPLGLTASIATSTCQTTGGHVLVGSTTTGKLDANCFDGAGNYTFSGSVSFPGTQTLGGGFLSQASSTMTATTSIAASSVTNRALILNGQAYSFPSSGIASSTGWGFDATGKATYVPLATTTTGILSIASNSGANAVSLAFPAAPRIIRMSWTYLPSGNNVAFQLTGQGVYNVQTGTYSEIFGSNSGASGGGQTATVSSDTSAIVSGSGASNLGTFTGAISAVSATGFTLTMTNATGATPTVKIFWSAEI